MDRTIRNLYLFFILLCEVQFDILMLENVGGLGLLMILNIIIELEWISMDRDMVVG